MKALSQTQASHLDVNRPLTPSLLLGDVLYTLCILFFSSPPLQLCNIMQPYYFSFYPSLARLDAVSCCNVLPASTSGFQFVCFFGL